MDAIAMGRHSGLAKMLDLQRRGIRPIATLDGVERSIISNESELKKTPHESSMFPLMRRPTLLSTNCDEKKPQPYIKIALKISDEMVLYEKRSMTALRDTDDGIQVAEDNQRYEDFFAGKTRRTIDMETQTKNPLQKSRDVNTVMQTMKNVISYVSKFEMYDTYKFLEKSTESFHVHGEQQINVTTYTVHGVDKFIEINQSNGFAKALMITLRILASNVFEKQQRRFRNMYATDPLAIAVHYLYRLQLLWRNAIPAALQSANRRVSDISWCCGNGDIYAVAYGGLNYTSTPNQGCVCIWNIKNPINAERTFWYEMPVVTVEFSPFVANLLAIGLHDGTCEVRDIAKNSRQQFAPLAHSSRSCNSSGDPIVAIKWLPQSTNSAECNINEMKIEPFLALSRAGVIIKYHVINSPMLLGFQQMRLECVEGQAEGQRSSNRIQATRTQGLNLCLDPIRADIYYVLTDKGNAHKCSTNYPHQHLEVYHLYSHVACNAMEFSPWSPKLYLTCGNDWNVCIWIMGISKPLLLLEHQIGPVYNACWSKTHSTVIITIGHKTISVWDISRRTLKPMSTINSDDVVYTTFKLSNCEFSLVVGTQEGAVLLYALEDMPFQPHFQYDKLESAIFKIIADDVEMKNTVQSFGYLGY